MLQKTVDFDLRKWASYERGTIQPYVHSIISEILAGVGLSPDEALYRGGFGRKEDLERLLKTGSDYESFRIDVEGKKAAALYAVPIGRVGSEPWCRGLDPLYWALKGHSAKAGENDWKRAFLKYCPLVPDFFSKNGRWNPLNALIAYRRSELICLPGSDVAAFRNAEPSPDALAAVIMLNLQYKKEVRRMNKASEKEWKKEAKGIKLRLSSSLFTPTLF